MSDLLFERRGAVAWITINRPEANNTLSAEAFVGLADAWQEVRENADIRVAVVTAAGERDFSCGGDLANVIPIWTGARKPSNPMEERMLAEPRLPSWSLLRETPVYKPIIAAVNGRALGGGCELLQGTDVRIAVPHAIFGLPEAKIGMIPGGGSMVRLARQISYANAMKMMLTGDPIDAPTALAWGLISEIVDKDKLLARAEELAARIAANAPLALTAIKRTVLESHTASWTDAFAIEDRESAKVVGSVDSREGPRAFKEKRTPVFTGK
ncbi:MAG: enoyl-CoA hydratase-related protein [Rhodocyclales bacterium]|nr:enoyl-CoA hydratase-related protein [Rhodocyclales bacterium]